jgi:hypothetical protein
VVCQIGGYAEIDMATIDNNDKSLKRLFGIIGCGGCFVVGAIVLLAVAGLLTTLLVFIEPDERGAVWSPSPG